MSLIMCACFFACHRCQCNANTATEYSVSRGNGFLGKCKFSTTLTLVRREISGLRLGFLGLVSACTCLGNILPLETEYGIGVAVDETRDGIQKMGSSNMHYPDVDVYRIKQRAESSTFVLNRASDEIASSMLRLLMRQPTKVYYHLKMVYTHTETIEVKQKKNANTVHEVL